MAPEPRGYSIIRSHVNDPRRFEAFRHAQAKLREAFGGRYLAQTRELDSIAGTRVDGLLTIAEYPSVGKLRQKLASYEHTVLHDSLVGTGTDEVWIAPGIDPAPTDATGNGAPTVYLLARAWGSPSGVLARLTPAIRSLAKSHGGTVLIDTDRVEALAGASGPQRILLVEFPSREFLSAARGPAGLQEAARSLDPDGHAEICAVPGVA